MSCSEFNFQTGTCTEVEKDFNFAKVMTVRDLDNVIVDLTGLTFQLVVKDTLAGSVLFTLDHVGDNLTTGLYIPNPSSGVINIQIIKADVTGQAAGVYPYEMTKTDTDGLLTIFSQGTLQFSNRGF
jgi:hypothetical protein